MIIFDTKEDEDAYYAKLEKQQEKASAPPPAPRRIVYHCAHPTYPHVGKVRSLKDVQAQQKPKEWIVDEFGVSGACGSSGC